MLLRAGFHVSAVVHLNLHTIYYRVVDCYYILVAMVQIVDVTGVRIHFCLRCWHVKLVAASAR